MKKHSSMLVPEESPETRVERTLQALKSNYHDTISHGPKEKCIIIGDRGSGKSTLTRFLAKNGGHLTITADFSIECSDEEQQMYVMQITSPITNVVHDVHIVQFIDFEQIADFDNYVVKAFDMNRTLSLTPTVKLLLIMESDIIFKNQNRFTIFFQHLAKILPDFSTIKYSVGLVVTKVDPSTKNQVVFNRVTSLLKCELQHYRQQPSRNAQIKYNVLAQQLNMLTMTNCEIYSEHYNRNVEELLKNLLEVNIKDTCFKVSTPKFICIFRKPHDIGLVSDILSDDRNQIMTMLTKMDYTHGPITMDLNYTLWESHKDHVSNLVTFIKSKLWTLSSILFEYYDLKILDCSNVFELKQVLNFESKLFSAKFPHAQQMFDFILSILADLLQAPTSQAQQFKQFVDEDLDFYIELLTFLQGGEKLFHDHEFDEIGGGLVKYFERWNVFLSFLLALEKQISSMSENLEQIFNFDYNHGWIVNETNFIEFLEKAKDLGLTVAVDNFPEVDELFLKHLNELLIRKHSISLPDVKRDFRKTIVSKQFVLILGPAESGKSTLIQSLTGSQPNQIRPENNVALTVTHNGIQYIECPNWIEVTNFLKRLETMLLLEDLLMIMSSCKIIFILDMSRSDMSAWLLKAIRILQNFVMFKEAIGFVITKSVESQCDTFMKRVLTELQSAVVSESERLFFEQIFTKTHNRYDNVEFTHTNQVDQMIEELNFVTPNFDNLDFTVCLKAEVALMFFIRALNQQYLSVLSQSFDYYDTLDELIVIAEKVKSFMTVVSDPELSSMPQFVGSLMALAKINPENIENYQLIISQYSSSGMLTLLKLDFYDLAKKRNFDLVAKSITISSTMAFVTLLVDVDKILSTYETQINKQTYTFRVIDSSNVEVFLNQLTASGNFCYFSLDILNYSDQRLINNLQSIYSRTVLSKTSTTDNGLEKTLTIRGNFVVCSNIDEAALEKANEIEIFATDTIFIDKNINSMFKLKKITVIAPDIDVRVKPVGIVNCFFVCQTLCFDQKKESNIFGPLSFNKSDLEVKKAETFSKFGIQDRIQAYLDSHDQTIRTKKYTAFQGSLSESLEKYQNAEFNDTIDEYLPINGWITQLEYLNQLSYLTHPTQPNLFWYKKLHSELLAYETSGNDLSGCKPVIIRKLRLLTFSKIQSFYDRKMQTKLKTNMEDQYHKTKRNLKEINKLTTADALLREKRKLQKKFTANMKISQNCVTRCAKDLERLDLTFNFEKVSEQTPMQITQQVILEVMGMFNDSLKNTELALNVAFTLTKHGLQTVRANGTMLELSNSCDRIIAQLETDNYRWLNGKFEILKNADIDLTHSEADAAIRKSLEYETDSIQEDLQLLNIPEQECPAVKDTRIIQKLSKNDKLYMVKKRYAVFSVSENLYAACGNDDAKIEQAFDVIHPFLDGFKRILAIRSQVQSAVLKMYEYFCIVNKELAVFFQDPKIVHIEQVFKKFKNFILSFTANFDLHKFSFSLFGRIEVAVHSLDQSFKYLDNFRSHIHMIELFQEKVETNCAESQGRFRKFLSSIDAQIKADLLLKEYNRGVVVVENFVFPFANKFLPRLKAPIYNQNSQFEDQFLTTKLLETFVENLMWIRRSTNNQSSPIRQLLHQRMTQYIFSPQSVQKLFEWRHEQHFGEIFKLLNGEKVFLTADIDHGFNTKDVVKFSQLELSFRARDAAKQPVIDAHLKRASIKMRHSGKSFYKLNNKVFVITTNDQQLVYSNDRGTSGEPSSANGVAKTLKNNDPILSPFTTWKLQVAVNKNKSNLLHLFTEGVEIDLHLVGTCCYLNGEEMVEKSAEDFYLSLDEGIYR